MATFVLVHGSWAGAWSWEQVVPLLERAGHRVVAFDLPGHGTDPTPPAEVTLPAYVDRVGAVLAQQLEPVVLVGHSHGGVVITQAAERYPETIAALVYVCAYLPRNGEPLVDLAQADPDPTNNILQHVIFDQAGGVATLQPEGAQAALFADVPPEEARQEEARLGVEPLASSMTPVRTTAERFGQIPRVYITCTNDRAISPALQERMYTATPCTVIAIESGHCPFLSKPVELVSHLTALPAARRAVAAGLGT